jgi:hypothetical protein
LSGIEYLGAMKFLFTILLAVEAVSAWSQKDSSADCVTYWKKGETKVYSILHEKITDVKDSASRHFSFTYEAHITVLDATEEDYTIKWVFHVPQGGNKELIGIQPLPVFEGMQMIFKISSVGTFIELINWEEVRDGYVHLSGTVYSTKESVEAALIKEIQLFHQPYGYKFTTRKISENTQLSNPLGGDPLPAVQTYQITQLDRRQDRFTLSFHQDLDKSSLDKVTFDISDHSEYEFIWSSGWIRQVQYNRVAGNKDMKQSDAYTITLKD